MNFAIEDTCGKLVNIWQIKQALNKVVDEPRSVLHAICDILLSLLVTSHLLITTPWTCHHAVLVWYIVWISSLRFVVFREKELNIPGEDCTLSATREKLFFLLALDIAETVLCSWYM